MEEECFRNGFRFFFLWFVFFAGLDDKLYRFDIAAVDVLGKDVVSGEAVSVCILGVNFGRQGVDSVFLSEHDGPIIAGPLEEYLSLRWAWLGLREGLGFGGVEFGGGLVLNSAVVSNVADNDYWFTYDGGNGPNYKDGR